MNLSSGIGFPRWVWVVWAGWGMYAATGCGGGSAKVAPTSFALVQHVESASEAAGTVTGVATVTLNAPAVAPGELSVNSTNDSEVHAVNNPLVIPSGQREANVDLVVADLPTVGPDRTYTITVTGLDAASSTFDFLVTDDESRALTLAVDGPVAEDAGVVTLRGTLAGALAQPVEVTFSGGEAAGLLLSPVTIPRGATGFQATGSVTDNNLLDFERQVEITAQPVTLLEPGTVQVTIEDNESNVLTLTAASPALRETDGTVADALAISVAAPLAADLKVTLASDDPTSLQVPASVTIPAGAQSTSVAVTVLDDNLLQVGNHTVGVTATADAMTSGRAAFTIADNETGALVFQGSQSSVDEGAGVIAGWGTVSTGTAVAEPLVVTLASSDESELQVPNSVTVPAGEASVTFPLTVVDDALLDFDQQVTLTAVSSLGSGQQSVTVTDNESPALSLTVNVPQVAENAGTVPAALTVSTSAPVEAGLSVSVVSADTYQLQTQTDVTIPALTSSADITVYPVDNSVLTLDRDVMVTASSFYCVDASVAVHVHDDDGGYAVKMMSSTGVEDWVDFGAMPGFMVGSDWAVVERFNIPSGAALGGYEFMRGNYNQNLDGDVAIQLLRAQDAGVWKWSVGAWIVGGATLSMSIGQNGVDIVEGSTWHTAVLQYEQATQTASLYVDGVLMDSATYAPIDDTANDNPLVWGGQVADASFAVGDLGYETDSVMAHQAWLRRVLTPAEISAYGGSVDLNDPTLQLSTAIGDGVVIDASGHGHDGTVHGDPVFYKL